jgi:hypothetical protein
MHGAESVARTTVSITEPEVSTAAAAGATRVAVP